MSGDLIAPEENRFQLGNAIDGCLHHAGDLVEHRRGLEIIACEQVFLRTAKKPDQAGVIAKRDTEPMEDAGDQLQVGFFVR